MTGKFHATHAALIGIILAVSGFITWSAIDAQASLNNLIVVAPVASMILLLSIILVATSLLKPAPAPADDDLPVPEKGIWGDVLLLAGFAVFCYALTKLGFDVATFFFVWAGVIVSGGKGWWQPPLFAAIFTVLLVYGFGSLFPYPMLTLVL